MVTLLAYDQAVDIGYGRGRLAADAAVSLARVDAAVGHPLQVTEAWRSPEDADANYRRYQAYLSGGKYAPIALPASGSIHCRGYAIDTDEQNVPVLTDHGWFRTVYRGGVLVEPWHFEYDLTRDQHINDGGFLMALTDAQQVELFQNIGAIRSLVEPLFHEFRDGRPEYYEGKYTPMQILLSVTTQIFDKLGGNAGDIKLDVDENALAAALAPLLQNNIGHVPDVAIAEIAKAVTDEQAKRLAG